MPDPTVTTDTGVIRLHAPLVYPPQGLAWQRHGSYQDSVGDPIDWTPHLDRAWCCDLIPHLLDRIEQDAPPIDLENARGALHFARQLLTADRPADATLQTAAWVCRQTMERLRLHYIDHHQAVLATSLHFAGEAICTVCNPRETLSAFRAGLPLASRVTLACLMVAEHLEPAGDRYRARIDEAQRQREMLLGLIRDSGLDQSTLEET